MKETNVKRIKCRAGKERQEEIMDKGERWKEGLDLMQPAGQKGGNEKRRVNEKTARTEGGREEGQSSAGG